MIRSDDRPVTVLKVRSVPHDVPEEIRMRRLLKALLRGYGFRLVSITWEPEVFGRQPEPEREQ